jgi:hypothetical protein
VNSTAANETSAQQSSSAIVIPANALVRMLWHCIPFPPIRIVARLRPRLCALKISYIIMSYRSTHAKVWPDILADSDEGGVAKEAGVYY